MTHDLAGYDDLVEGLKIKRDNGLLTVVINRPERRNAFTAAMYSALNDLWKSLKRDASVRVVVLKGAGGKAFAAGNEISDFLAQDPVPYEVSIRDMLSNLWEVPQVTIAAVDGVCVGGGLAVATHCDLRVATPHSRFGYPIARTLGNALSSPVLYRCAAVFGESLTKEMLLTSRLVKADRAYSAGALLAVTDELDAEVADVVHGILQASRVTLQTTKTQMRTLALTTEIEPDGERELLQEIYTGEDFTEGVRAFLAKEKPRFK